MNNELSPGGLALVIHCRSHPENVGKIVTVVRLLQPGEQFKDTDGRMQRYVGNIAGWLVEGNGIISIVGDKGFAVFRQTRLMPIKPDEEPESNEASQSVTDADRFAPGGSF